jgi:LmbE family N-acetylglucosaminyl deacetylase
MERTALFVGAHPDDVEAGAGGLAAHLAAMNWRVVIFVATHGMCGGPPARRIREQEQAAAILKAELVWGNFLDGELKCDRNLIARLDAALLTFDPLLVLTHSPNDTHQDHRCLSQATVAAARRHANVLFFEGPSTYAFQPTMYHPIDETYDIKLSALSAHESQLCRTAIQGFVEATARRRGFEARSGVYAEGFVPFRTQVFLDGGDS